MRSTPPVKYDRNSITYKIAAAYSLCIHPDVDYIIAAIYIRLMHQLHINQTIATQLFNADPDMPLYIFVEDHRIYKKFMEDKICAPQINREPRPPNKFYHTLTLASAHAKNCAAKTIISLCEYEQMFNVMIISCTCHDGKIYRKCVRNYREFSYDDIVEFLVIAHENSLYIEQQTQL